MRTPLRGSKQLSGAWAPTVFADESRTPEPRFDAENGLYLFALTMPAQVQLNLESQRRQYELVDEARQQGFRDVEVIDDDLGRSASGTVARPGFEKLVAWLCAGEVGAVLTI
jgi:hypothetical protein